MQLGAAILISSWPCLIVAQAPVTITNNADLSLNLGDASQGSNNQVPPVNTFSENTEAETDQKCVKHTPPLPEKFYAHRKFTSFFNTIVFKDMGGREFGFVESHFIDWKNPFGFPGATFYLKDTPALPRMGVWHMNATRGSYGWGQAGTNAATPPPGSATSINCGGNYAASCADCAIAGGAATCHGECVWHYNTCQLAVQCTELTTLAQCKTSTQCAWVNNACQVNLWPDYHEANEQQSSDAYNVENEKALNRGTYGHQQNRRAAEMKARGRNEGVESIFTTPFDFDMIIKDCNGNELFTATDDHILRVHNAGKESSIITQRGDSENVLLVQDRSIPVKDLIRVSMEEPCWPLFPPFCQQMGKSEWSLHPSILWQKDFEGRVIEPEYNQSTANNFINLEFKDGGATDMRFITLYSAYQFSNTRFSPLMTWINWILSLFCICVCCQCCCVPLPSRELRADEIREEQEKLMGTIEFDPEMNTRAPMQSKRGHFLGVGGGSMNCCSRRLSDPDQQRTFWERRKEQLSSGYESAKTKVKDSSKH